MCICAVQLAAAFFVIIKVTFSVGLKADSLFVHVLR